MIGRRVAHRDRQAKGFRLTCNRKGNRPVPGFALTAGTGRIFFFDARACQAHTYLESALVAKHLHGAFAGCRRRRRRTSCQQHYRSRRNDDFRNHAILDTSSGTGFHDTHIASGYKGVSTTQKKVADPKARHHFLTNLSTFDLLERVASAYEDTRSDDVEAFQPAVALILLATKEVRLLIKQVLDTDVQAEFVRELVRR